MTLAKLILLIAHMVEQNLIRLCIGFFSYSQLGKGGFANLYHKGFLIIFRFEDVGGWSQFRNKITFIP
jgi:hypothetical protein